MEQTWLVCRAEIIQLRVIENDSYVQICIFHLIFDTISTPPIENALKI